MPTVKGINQTLIDAGGLVSQIAAGLIDARVKIRTDSYALTTGNESGDIIELFGDLPKGAKIHLIMLSVTVGQGSLTFKLGTTFNDDEFAVTSKDDLQTAITPAWFNGKEYVVGTELLDSQIRLTTEAATAIAATLYAMVFYSVD